MYQLNGVQAGLGCRAGTGILSLESWEISLKIGNLTGSVITCTVTAWMSLNLRIRHGGRGSNKFGERVMVVLVDFF